MKNYKLIMKNYRLIIAGLLGLIAALLFIIWFWIRIGRLVLDHPWHAGAIALLIVIVILIHEVRIKYRLYNSNDLD